MDHSIHRYAIVTFLCCSLSNVEAENGNFLTQNFDIGAVRTELNERAIAFAYDRIPWLGEGDPTCTAKGCFLGYEIKVRQGGHDAFDGIVAKATGFTLRGDNPLKQDSYFIVPFSAGIESDSDADNAAVLMEVGFVPVLTNVEGPYYGFGTNRAGLFLQVGYKVADEAPTEEEIAEGGGDLNESEEEDSIVRLKFDLRHVFGAGNRVQLKPLVQYWYDFENSETYHHAELALEVDVSDVRLFELLGHESSLKFKWEDGSGGPNFNTGEQFTAALSFRF